MTKQSLKIWIPYRLFPVGGPISFLRIFKREMELLGHRVHISSYPPRHYTMILVIDACSLVRLIIAKLRGKKIIHRLDGVYYPALPLPHKLTYAFKDLRKRIIYRYIADHVIYQSQFSQWACETMFGQPPCSSSIILNGTDENKATATTSTNLSTIRLITHGYLREDEQLLPLFKTLNFLPDNYQLTVIGPISARLQKKIAPFKNNRRITFYAAHTKTQLWDILPTFDIYVFSQLSACPNSIIEALHAGLPVAAFARGGIPELIQNGVSGELVTLRPHHPLRQEYAFTANDYKALAEKIQLITGQLSQYKERARRSAQENLTTERMIEQYLSVFSKIIKK